MRVRCLADPTRVGREPRLTVGSEYVVLAIETSPKAGVRFRVLENRVARKRFQTPILVEASTFELLSNVISATWRVRVRGSSIALAPEPWLRPGFWEAIFDLTENSEWAREEYDHLVAILLEEDRQAREAGD